MQFRHAVGARALEAHHRNEILLQQTGLERIGQVLLILEHHGRRFDDLVFQRDRRDFHHATTKVAFHHPQAAFWRERTSHRPQDAFVEAFGNAFAPDQLAVVEERLLGVTAQAVAQYGVDVFVEQPGFQQFTDQERHAARRLEVVDVGFTVRVDVAQGRHHLGEVGHVLPGQLNTRRHGDGRHVQGVVGRAASGVQGDDGIDQ